MIYTKYECADMGWDCCDCGGENCGCAYCWSCHACENCLNDSGECLLSAD